MVNVLGQHVLPTRAQIATHPEWNVHDYGKAQLRHNRKMGHITVLTDDTARTVDELEATGCWDDLKPYARPFVQPAVSGVSGASGSETEA